VRPAITLSVTALASTLALAPGCDGYAQSAHPAAKPPEPASPTQPRIPALVRGPAQVTGSASSADSTDDSLRLYAVRVKGLYGVYLGNGLIITAAHVVGQTKKIGVRIAGLNTLADVIKQGAYERTDLSLLSVDEQKLPLSLRMRRMPLCERPPWAGQPVIVAIPENTARSHIMSPRLLSPDVRKRFPTLISDVKTTGNSGSGVFDAGRKCLLGIMSRKIQIRRDANDKPHDVAKYFVPASEIRAFIPADSRL
jgi:S1-C subfamily serine protease